MVSSDIVISSLQPDDWPVVQQIYAEGIATGKATFETTVPEWGAWDSSHLRAGRLTVCLAGQVVGWAALTPVSSRCVYAGVAEVSIYVSAAARGRGVGKKLLGTLIDVSEQAGIWMLQANVLEENTASILLHQTCGFRTVGRRERIAQLHGVWRNTVLLERRSAIVGGE